MNRRTLRGTLILAAGIAVASATAAVPAHADAPDTITVRWVVTSGDFANRFGTPQRIATASDTCGVLEQVDVYRYKTPDDIAFVDALTAKGVLTSAADDGPVWISNTDEDLGPCATSTPTPVPTETTAPPAPPAATSTPSPTATRTATASPTPSAASSGSPTPTATTAARTNGSATTATPTATTETLAFTGSRPSWPGYALGGGLVTAGLALVIKSRRRKNGAES